MLTTSELDNLRVVLVSTRNPLNIGAAARAMSNFGFHRLRVVRPYDPSFREAQSAVGAASLLRSAQVYTELDEAVKDCSLVVGTTAAQNRELRHPLKGLGVGARTIRRELKRGPVAVLFGSEKRGLSNDDLSHCHWLMRIPTVATSASMNLGQAVAVSLYEIARAGAAPRIAQNKPGASAGDLTRLEELLGQGLQDSGYTKGKITTAERQELRRLLRRLYLSQEDGRTLLGMLRQIVWKLRK